jgi:hypothetical protein
VTIAHQVSIAECYANQNRRNGDIFVLNEEHSLIRSRDVVSRCVGGETLIVPVRGKVGDLASIYSFNGTGSVIWKCLEKPVTVNEIAAELQREFSVTQEQALRDVARFIGEMFSVGLVEVSKATTGTKGPVGREGLEASGV